ncbi:methylated-DNA-[protein]-cysteine S-methyltransferase/AraC family transcriptional regulator, regulatory protein of adaptative response / methylated-DNA-[protein]-cysteine methyltransferase [Singulisphaera sp. GP187]|uniref:methylated-DNA--[protein]-cysteine S-methyltransferase n=1 Tax=Singulisphaera sp. GP187 TaxID=1882752 RepID=UPI000929917B|nr:methylated-DNA--[protein]-cysteine S-methyltransferase [Singulisphaera sp. GP187]SIO64851.1 methylated-DNA-[protein]-cysteine S-methyltransferase/AraC family transcriptional regulator, regulatory protein of adaptative response / methylated-DNA-[protein]-cysteine methyltransferase [Singulisphaera sp. GP187]
MKTSGGRSSARASVGTIRHGTGTSPLGPILVGMSKRGVCGLFVLVDEGALHARGRLHHHYPGAELIEDQTAVAGLFPRVTAFLYGQDDCRDLAIDMTSGTPFQQRVWESLRAIPRGQTRSYGEVAAAIGHPRAARAVGAACGINPVSLLVPCHRVVASGGALGGYGWGLERKKALLDLEQDE